MNLESSHSLYADPVVYDILYTPGTWREIDVLERIEREFARRSGRPLDPDRLWLEPACGSGRYLRTAAGRGRRTAGFDLDDRMLRYAVGRQQRKAGRPPQLFRADMAHFLDEAVAAGLRPGSVDFAFNPVNSIRHLTRDRDLLAHLQQRAELMRPGAVYVVGLSLTDYDASLPEEDLWTGARGLCRVSQLVNYLPPEPGAKPARTRQIERVLSHLTVERPGGIKHFDDVYDLRCYDHRQWADLIRKSALNLGGSFDAGGRPAGGFPLPYQLEALVRS